MKIILYIPPGRDPENIYIKRLGEIVPSDHTRVFNRFEDLSKHLTKPLKDIVLAVLMIKNAKQISQLLTMAPLLPELCIILVLPDRKKTILDLAYRLFPRYICTINDRFDELFDIIEKIIKTKSIDGYPPKPGQAVKSMT